MALRTEDGHCKYTLLFAFIMLFNISLSTSVSFDLTELRNKVSKIKVHPRGNLWATGILFIVYCYSRRWLLNQLPSIILYVFFQVISWARRAFQTASCRTLRSPQSFSGILWENQGFPRIWGWWSRRSCWKLLSLNIQKGHEMFIIRWSELFTELDNKMHRINKKCR